MWIWICILDFPVSCILAQTSYRFQLNLPIHIFKVYRSFFCWSNETFQLAFCELTLIRNALVLAHVIFFDQLGFNFLRQRGMVISGLASLYRVPFTTPSVTYLHKLIWKYYTSMSMIKTIIFHWWTTVCFDSDWYIRYLMSTGQMENFIWRKCVWG